MGSPKGAGVVVGVIVLLVPVVSWVVDRAAEFAASGSDLSLGWRVAIAGTNWYVRFLPFIVVGGVAVATAIGGYQSRACPLDQERRALLAWLVHGASYLFLPIVAPLIPNGRHVPGGSWIHGFTALVAVSIVAPVAAVGIGAHLQARIRTSRSSRIRGWHIVTASLLLAALGPALLIPPLWVWVRAGSTSTSPQTP